MSYRQAIDFLMTQQNVERLFEELVQKDRIEKPYAVKKELQRLGFVM